MATSPHGLLEERASTEVDGASGVVQTAQANLNDLVDPWCLREIERRGFKEFLYRRWTLDLDDVEPEVLDERLPEGLTLVRRGTLLDTGRMEAALEGHGAFAVIELVRRGLWVGVCGHDLASARRMLEALQHAFPEPDEAEAAGDEPAHVVVALWGHDDAGRGFSRLEVSPWADVATNYPEVARDQLAPFMQPGYRPDASGQLHVWHGVPGTGKSHALGSLAYAWREWASVAYVSDPEALFNDPGYLLELILRRQGERWRLVVLEDTGELFGRDARRETGQGLSRLLNVTDGMLGQGTKTVFVVTTNEPIGGFHEAVVRPGRCAARVEFPAFAVEESKKWLVDHGAAEAAERLSSPATLAEMYAMTRGEDPPTPSIPVGFQAP